MDRARPAPYFETESRLSLKSEATNEPADVDGDVAEEMENDRILKEPEESAHSRWLNAVRQQKRSFERRLGHLASPVMFLMVGGTGMVIDLTVFTLLLMLFTVPPARALAIVIAMTWNFWLNRRLTFSSSRSNAVLPQYLRFCLSCTVGATINWAVSILSTAIWPALTPQISAFIGIVAGTGFNYVLSKRLVFLTSNDRYERSHEVPCND